MNERKVPAYWQKAKEIAARVASPVGVPFSAKKSGKVCDLYVYDAIGKDPWSGTGVDPQDVIKALADAKGSDELAVHINSPGGIVFDGIAIFNAIRSFPGKKTVYVDGLAASIASIIALAGDRVVTNEGAMWMIHDPWGGIFSFGTADQIEEEARKTVAALRKTRENLLDIYTSATGRGTAEVSAWMSAETWMTAAEALERGFTDEVCKPEPMDPDEDEEMEPMPKKSAASLSPSDRVALARIKRRELAAKFPGASPGPSGQPGTTSKAAPETKS